MRVALAHDYLNQYGGAERVLEVFAEMFPEAPIYTLLYDETKTFGRFKGRDIRTSFLNHKTIAKNHRLFIPFMPLAASFLRIPDEYELVLASSAGYAKGISPRSHSAKHVVYCHTPLRYAWEPEYLTSKFGSRIFVRIVLPPLLGYLRRWDKRTAQKPDMFIANSHFIAEKIRLNYGRDVQVIHPPVDTEIFYPDKTVPRAKHFLAVGRLLHYKRFDLIVETFNQLGLPLKIVGDGPERKKLQQMARQNISFIPFESNALKLRVIYSSARALIFPQVEDFGLVAAEAIACGTPVVAYDGGGAKEIVSDGENGVLFSPQTKEALGAAVERILKMKFNPTIVAASAQKFSKKNFINRIKEAITKVL